MNYTKVVDEIFSQIHGERFDIILWNNQKFEYGEGKRVAFSIVFKDEKTAKRLISQGSLGFGESYMDGSLEVKGDLEAYLRIRHQFKNIKPSIRLALAAFLSARSDIKSREDQIAYHYDLGNDFFKIILDKKTMSYSSGLYLNGTEKLETAQTNKISLVCDWLDLPSGAKVLDLGSGWGGFALYAAQKKGWNITGCTLSKEQLKYCKSLIKTHSLKKQIDIHYRDITKSLPDGTFDGIVMLESIEHIGKQHIESFIIDLAKKLKPGGSLYIQTTGRYRSKKFDKWTLKYVFPGGYLPAKQELLDAATKSGLEVDRFTDDTQSYVHTMTEWINNLEKNSDKIEKMFDPSFYRLWVLWMHGAKVAFETNYMNLFRIRMKRPK